MIDLRRLQAFVAVAEEGHITRAAERLGMAQPPLSRLIRGLETELGTLLFRRLPRGVALTETGATLLEEARALLAQSGRIADTVRRTARGEQGRLAVGFTSSAALHPLIAQALLAFRTARPGVRLELDEADTAELVEAVVHGRIDAAFIRSPASHLDRLTVDTVVDEPMLAALPKDHPLAGAQHAVPLPDLSAEPFILYRRPTGPGLHDVIMGACKTAGFTPQVAQEAPRMPTTLSLVAAGLGISIVPSSMRRIAIEGVVFRAISHCPGLSAPIALALRRTTPSATATAFRDTVRRLSVQQALASQHPAD